MIVVIGRFRLPPEQVAAAKVPMQRVIAASRAEAGCFEYAYAEDLAEPDLFRVSEAWESIAAFEAHFATPHMRAWQAEREALGFHDRDIAAFEVGPPLAL